MAEAALFEFSDDGVVAQPTAQLRVLPKPAAPGTRAASAPRLEVRPYDFASARALEAELGVSHVLAEILVRRGYRSPGAARAFLAAADEHDSGRFAGIERATSLIRRHIANGSRITVHGDYDVDGVCATAILIRALRALGGRVGWFLPSRVDDGYGLSAATVSRLATRGTELLITVDCGITAVEEVEAARRHGLDVVISDHHAPRRDGRLPDAPIVHPAVCGYPCPELCGTGVAYKLAQALGAETAEADLDLVALATVADLVPLNGENRRLVRVGLRTLASTAKPGLRALMAVSNTDPSGIAAHALGFRLAPRINAAGRLYRADAGVELMLTEDDVRAGEIAVELDAANAERRLVEQRITWEAESQVAELGQRPAYVLAGQGWHPGVIGIVASRIVENHHRPTVLIALEGERGSGSGRSILGFDLLGALDACGNELIGYGGHRAAAGLTIDAARVAALRERFEAHAAATLTPDLLTPLERIDAIVSGPELGLALAEELERLEPCGLGNPAPRLLVPGARLEDARPIGERRHVRFSLVSGGARARAVSFGCDGRLAVEPGEPVDASFRLERSVWRGMVEARLVLRHAEPCRAGAIDVVGEAASYLEGMLAEFDAPLEARAGGTGGPADSAARRTVLDRRDESPIAVLADAVSTGSPVIAVCAEPVRRLAGLASRTGGFALASHHAVQRDPAILKRFVHVVAVDPPTSETAAELLAGGEGFAHSAWGPAELRFAEQMHELEFGLRASLVALYRGLRRRERVTGQELEHLLRGDGPHGWPARLAGRLVRVLVELELVSLDRDLPALAVGGGEQTELHRSPAYRVYEARYKDGQRYLSSANPRPRN